MSGHILKDFEWEEVWSADLSLLPVLSFPSSVCFDVKKETAELGTVLTWLELLWPMINTGSLSLGPWGRWPNADSFVDF